MAKSGEWQVTSGKWQVRKRASQPRCLATCHSRLLETLVKLTCHLPLATCHSPVYRAHHGSLSLEERRATEEALKNGELAAVVATASLELGIDMGAVDLVCQVESPGEVSRGLQRVGRAGHVVHGTSRGRLIAKSPADLLESAALCRAMLAGRDRAPASPAGMPGRPGAAGGRVRRGRALGRARRFSTWSAAPYPYRDLTAGAFESVLRLISGRFPSPGLRDLRARVAWDPIHNRLARAARHGAACAGRRRDDPRHGPVPGLPGRRRPSAGRAGRGIRLRATGRRDLHAGQRGLADRGDRAASRAGQPRRGPAGRDAVLARRGGLALARAGRGGRPAQPRDRRSAR